MEGLLFFYTCLASLPDMLCLKQILIISSWRSSPHLRRLTVALLDPKSILKENCI